MGPLHYRELEKGKIKAFNQNKNNWEAYMTFSDRANDELQWWLNTVNISFCSTLRPDPDLIITTDASLTAWGAVCDGIRTGGAWSHHEANHMHINELELLAAFFGLKTLAKEMINKHIQVYVDNTVAMACLNKMGSSKTEKLNALTKVVWQWCYARNLRLTVARIPGSEKLEDDHESRQINLDTEWKLDSETLNTALGVLKFQPDIDLFASRLNRQFEMFIPFRPDPEAYKIDALSFNWRAYNFYAFPPFSLLSRLLQKVKQDEATGIVVAPLWPTQASPAFGKKTPAIVTESPQPSTSTTQEIETDDMYGIRRLQEQGFSGTASDVIMASLRPDKIKVYNVYIKKWRGYPDKEKMWIQFHRL